MIRIPSLFGVRGEITLFYLIFVCITVNTNIHLYKLQGTRYKSFDNCVGRARNGRWGGGWEEE